MLLTRLPATADHELNLANGRVVGAVQHFVH